MGIIELFEAQTKQSMTLENGRKNKSILHASMLIFFYLNLFPVFVSLSDCIESTWSLLKLPEFLFRSLLFQYISNTFVSYPHSISTINHQVV